MKWILLVLGILLVLAGGVWVLQGLNVLTQGSMAGKSQWTVIGAVVAVLGAAMIVLGALQRKKSAG
jgi:drug/metabolite transporter superfamily protein YnfA